MAWFQFDQTMPTHKKTLRLARALHVSRFEAIGIMCSIWCWALDNANIIGEITGATSQDIADAIGYDRPSEELINALISSGFFDKDNDNLKLHDWYDYAGKLMTKREENKLRMREARAKHAQGTCDVHEDNVQSTCMERVMHPNNTCAKSGDPENSKEQNKTLIKPNRAANKDSNMQTDGAHNDQIEEIISHLNLIAGKAFRPTTKSTRKLIQARLSEGYTIEDFKNVITDRCHRWKRTDQEQYLRPETLFGTKFESYLNAIQVSKPQAKEYYQSSYNVFEDGADANLQ